MLVTIDDSEMRFHGETGLGFGCADYRLSQLPTAWDVCSVGLTVNAWDKS
jgi:hypothetical protein